MPSFQTADVFTDRIFGGNPLAVFPDASGIPEESLQPLANGCKASAAIPRHVHSLSGHVLDAG